MDIDVDVLATMNSLQCFKDKEKLVQELLNNKHNTEKIVYFLLLDRKLRQPSEDDADEVKAKSSIYTDPPKKRVDAMPLNKQHPRFSLGSLTEGSPLAPRRALTIQQWRRNKSLQNCSSNASLSSMVTTSPSSSSSSEAMIIASSKSSTNIDNSRIQITSLSSPKHVTSTVQSTSDNSMQRQHRRQHSLQSRIQSQQQQQPANYRQKLLHLTQQQKIQQKQQLQQQQQQQLQVPSPVAGEISPTMTSSPPSSPSTSTSTQFGPWKARLHSLKNSFLGSPRFHRKKLQKPSTEDLTLTPGSSSEFTKKSWFGALIGSERDEQCFVMVKDKNMGQVKADLIHAFLCMPDLSHTVLSPTSFHAEYRRNTSASVFSRHVKLQASFGRIYCRLCVLNVVRGVNILNFIR